ncbi:BatA domain-containing protein [Nannocystis punicea]|uniref:BatA domain-containing protein n=1 Tax=Nannocystis punicea TaxID=2995304 RepID=A0ABY7HA45_9BACT|nr:BatA domain-containing protein [Nannocystis poenicansa]WAS96113.1 BatA domain-containing protein [Nannocystis poenicansa]
MSLLAPLLLLGLLGLAAPLIAHLRGREEPRKIAFAATRFVRTGDEVVTMRRHLRDRLLLGLRLAALALLALALARPVSSGRARVAVLGEPHDAILLVDGSLSMSLRTDRVRALDGAADAAAAVVDALPPGSRVGLVTSDPSGPRLELSADLGLAREAIGEWLAGGAPRAGAWPLDSGLPVAAALLRGDAGGRRRAVYAIGDPTARGLGSLPETAGPDTPVLPVPALGSLDALPPVPEHLSLDSVGWEPARDLDPRAVRVWGVVRRHAPGPLEPDNLRRVAVAMQLGGEEVARADVMVPRGGEARVEFTHTLIGDGPSPASLALVELADDPLPGDEVRHFWLAGEDELDIVLVNGDPSEMRAHDEVFFLATALSAAPGRRLRVHGLAPDQLEARLREPRPLAGVDVVVLANVRAPAPDAAAALARRVEEGLGLFVTVGERVEAAAYNDRLGELLPLRLREALVVGTAPGRTENRTEGLAPANLAHPALRGLGDDLGLLGARTRRLFLLEPDAARPVDVALSFTSGAPALITHTHGRGRVALLTTSVDRDWSDLPLRPGFVPLVERLVAYLDASQQGAAGAVLRVGEPRILPGDRPATVITPTGERLAAVPDGHGEAVFKDTWVPGHYTVERGEDEPPLRFAVQVDPAESDTTPRAVAGPQIEGDEVLAAARYPRWRPLVLLVALILLIESILRWRLTTRRGQARGR